MTSQNVDAVSEKIAKNGLMSRTFFQRENFLLPTSLYVVRYSFEKVGAETAEKVCLEKKNWTQNIMVVLCYTEGDLNKELL